MKSYDIRLIMKDGETKKYVSFGNNKMQAYKSIILAYGIKESSINHILTKVI